MATSIITTIETSIEHDFEIVRAAFSKLVAELAEKGHNIVNLRLVQHSPKETKIAGTPITPAVIPSPVAAALSPEAEATPVVPVEVVPPSAPVTPTVDVTPVA
jgi:hypothetical protein